MANQQLYQIIIKEVLYLAVQTHSLFAIPVHSQTIFNILTSIEKLPCSQVFALVTDCPIYSRRIVSRDTAYIWERKYNRLFNVRNLIIVVWMIMIIINKFPGVRIKI